MAGGKGEVFHDATIDTDGKEYRGDENRGEFPEDMSKAYPKVGTTSVRIEVLLCGGFHGV